MSLSREQMLVEMGITPLWVLRDHGSSASPVPLSPDPSPMNGRGEANLSSLPLAGERLGERGGDAAPSSLVSSVAGEPPASAATQEATGDWPELAEAVAACRLCPLCQQRKQAVLGVGDRQPDWLFIGEGPGAEEDARGEPFVGQAGKLLDNMLAALDIARGNRVYIGNAVKCRPPGNRTPEAVEIAACRPYLDRQIALLQPKIIVLLGKVAVHSVLREDKSLASLRGRCFEHAGIPVTVTYHPAYLLRNLPDKAKAWEDLLFARRILRTAGGG